LSSIQSNTETIPAPALETLPTEPQSPEKSETVISEKQALGPEVAEPPAAEPPAVSVVLQPHPVSKRTLSRSKLGKLKKADLVLGFVLNSDSRAMLGNLPSKTLTAVWNLLIEVIESGAYGPATSDTNVKGGQDGKISIRLLFPWLTMTAARHYDLQGFNLTNDEHRAKIRKHLLPIARDHIKELLQDPHKFGLLVNKDRVERERIERERILSGKREQAVAKAKVLDEKPVIAYGIPLWPPIDGLQPRYTYDELRHAFWFITYLMPSVKHETVRGNAIFMRHLIKFVTPMLHTPGWGNAARDFIDAYEANPDGECQLPRGEVNFGMR
jgi:hypothetical protein